MSSTGANPLQPIAEHEAIVLSPVDSAALSNALANPPPLNERLRRALNLHSQHVTMKQQ